MKTFVRCGQLFNGREDEARPDGMLVFEERGSIEYAGVEAGSPRRDSSRASNRSCTKNIGIYTSN